MIRYKLIAALLAACLAAIGADPAALDALVERSRTAWSVPGVAVVIVKDDQVIHLKGYGVKESGKPAAVSPDTRFAIGSTTKAFTTALMAMLADEGRLNWDDPVRRHLPGFHLADPAADGLVTLRDLVSHRTGLARHDELWAGGPWGRDELVRRIGFVSLDKPFRSRWQYQNIMFLVAGLAAANTAGSSWDDLVKKRIFEPLGMSNSDTSVKAALAAPDVASPHARGRDGRAALIPWRNIDNVGPAGSINSSARDLANWIRLQLNGGIVDGKRMISEKQTAEMHTPQMAMRPEDAGRNWNPEAVQPAYGMGWFLGEYRGHRLVSHGGAIDGFRANITLVPRERLGLAVLANLGSDNMPEALRWSLLDALLGLPARDWDAELMAHFKAERPAEVKRVTGTRPSLEPAAYQGLYTNPGYGEAVVSRSGSGLSLSWRGQTPAPMEHFHYDTFVVPRVGLAQFRLDSQGRSASLILFDTEFARSGAVH